MKRYHTIISLSILAVLGTGYLIMVNTVLRQPNETTRSSTNQTTVKGRMVPPSTSPRVSGNGSAGSQGEYQLPKSSSTGLEIHQGQIPIIMYHYIRVNDPEDEKGFSLSVTPEHFRQQLDNLQQRGYQTVTFQDLARGHIPAKPIILTFDDGYEDFITTAYPELVRHKMTAVVYVIANFQKTEYLTPWQILYLANNGIEIGSHTLDHVQLTRVPVEEATRQISLSKRTLEIMVGQPVVSFAYPFGDYTTEIVHDAYLAGYQYAVTTVGGLADLAQPMELMRFRAKDIPTLEFDDNIAKTEANSNSEKK